MYTTNSNHKLHSNYIAASKDCRGRATDGFIQPRWRANDVVQRTTIAEFVPKISIASSFDDNEIPYGSYTEGYRTGSINGANNNANRSRVLCDDRWSLV